MALVYGSVCVPLFLFLIIAFFSCNCFNVEWAKVIVPFVGALIALAAFAVPFYKNSRIKTIETLMALEKDYREHLHFLLEIETNFTNAIYPVLVREVADRNEINNNPLVWDKEILRKLDGVLRHFAICSKAKDEQIAGSGLTFDISHPIFPLVSLPDSIDPCVLCRSLGRSRNNNPDCQNDIREC